MKKLLYLIPFVILLTVFAFLGSYYLVRSTVLDCTSSLSVESGENEGLFFGKIKRIKEDEENQMKVVTLGLCDGIASNILSITIYIPNPGVVQFLEFKDNLNAVSGEGYFTHNGFDDKVRQKDYWGVRGNIVYKTDRLEETKQLLSESGQDCFVNPQCRGPEYFKNNHEKDYDLFISHLKKKNTLGLLTDFLFGKAKIYSTDFFNVADKQEFQQVIEYGLI